MSSDDDPLKRDRWARLRFAIIGPLLAAPPAAGDLQAALAEDAGTQMSRVGGDRAQRLGGDVEQ